MRSLLTKLVYILLITLTVSGNIFVFCLKRWSLNFSFSFLSFFYNKASLSKKNSRNYDSRTNSLLRRLFLHKQLFSMQKKSEPLDYTSTEESNTDFDDKYLYKIEEQCSGLCDSYRKYSQSKFCYNECIERYLGKQNSK